MKYQLPAKPKPRPELLLHPNIPKPLHGLSPRTIMGQEWWDKIRKEVYASTGFHCAACGVHQSAAQYKKWLEAHEFYDFDYEKGTATLKEIVPLCHFCHSYIHSGYLNVRYSKGEITRDIYQSILVHGRKLTKDLKRPQIPGVVAAWSDWRLIFEGKEYKPLFDSFDHWHYHYYGCYPQGAYEDLMDEDDDEGRLYD